MMLRLHSSFILFGSLAFMVWSREVVNQRAKPLLNIRTTDVSDHVVLLVNSDESVLNRLGLLERVIDIKPDRNKTEELEPLEEVEPVRNLGESQALKRAKRQSETSCGKSVYGLSSCQAETLDPKDNEVDSNPDVLSRIVGGHIVDPNHKNKFPWQAYIQVCENESAGEEGRKCLMCGGTVINDRWILTAAHCLSRPEGILKDVLVLLGAYNFQESAQDASRVYKVDQIGVHPSFDSSTVSNDIALLRVDRPIKFDDNVTAACLPSDEPIQDYIGKKGVIAGWGSTAFKGDPSLVLKETVVEILDNYDDKCWPLISVLPDKKLCAHGDKTDACQGDSGGALLIGTGSGCTVIGIVSYGYECASPDHGGIYTRVDKYLDWIQSIMDGTGESMTEEPIDDGCDLSCTNVKHLTGNFQVNGRPAKCYKGTCKSEATDLCNELEYPCEVLLCQSPCDLSRYISKFMNDPSLPTYITLEVLGIKVECNQHTGYCCAVENEDKNLCLAVLMAFFKKILESLTQQVRSISESVIG